MKKVLVMAGALLCIVAGYYCGSRGNRMVYRATAPRLVVVRDTVRLHSPPPIEINVIGRMQARVGRNDIDSISSDSCAVDLPRLENVYEAPDYRAYVSGFDARLDSLVLTPVRTEIHVPAYRSGRFSVGLQGGVGITPDGIRPYIGLGVSIRLF